MLLYDYFLRLKLEGSFQLINWSCDTKTPGW